jgi:hypothetical protein
LLEEVHVLRCELAASHLASTRIFGYHSREVIRQPSPNDIDAHQVAAKDEE